LFGDAIYPIIRRVRVDISYQSRCSAWISSFVHRPPACLLCTLSTPTQSRFKRWRLASIQYTMTHAGGHELEKYI